MPDRTETIELNGESWTIYKRYKHGARVATEDATKKWLRRPETKIEPNGTVEGETTFDFDEWDSYSAENALLLAMTTDWSYGDVQESVLKSVVDEDHRDVVLARVNEIVAASPLAPRPAPSANERASD